MFFSYHCFDNCETSRLVKFRHPVSGADCELHVVVAPSDGGDLGRSILHLLDVLDVPELHGCVYSVPAMTILCWFNHQECGKPGGKAR